MQKGSRGKENEESSIELTVNKVSNYSSEVYFLLFLRLLVRHMPRFTKLQTSDGAGGGLN